MKILLSQIFFVWGMLFVFTQADCTKKPTYKDLEKAIVDKSIEQAKRLLSTLEADVKTYLKTCDNSKEMFEQTSVQLLTFKDKISDLVLDMSVVGESTIDCQNVPKTTKLKSAFKTSDTVKIEASYQSYKKDAEAYLESCTSHEEYEFVFEDALFYDEEYTEWKKKTK